MNKKKCTTEFLQTSLERFNFAFKTALQKKPLTGKK